jgi:hypothetical protein
MNVVDVKQQIRKFFKDKHGNIIIFQPPNPAIIGWVIFLGLSFLFEPGSLQKGSELLARAFLFTWAYLEVTKGVNYFRRLLGGIVLSAILVAFFR